MFDTELFEMLFDNVASVVDAQQFALNNKHVIEYVATGNVSSCVSF